jgi:hypothetical protein
MIMEIWMRRQVPRSMFDALDAASPQIVGVRVRSAVRPFRRLDGSIAAASDNLAPFAKETRARCQVLPIEM